MIGDEDIKYAQRVFDVSRVAFMNMMPGELIRDHAALDLYADHFTDMLMARLSSYVLTEQLVNETHQVSMDVPASPWQTWKEQHMPRRFRRWFPIRLKTYSKTVTFDARGTYPYADIAIPFDKLGNRVVFESVEESPWRDDDRGQ